MQKPIVSILIPYYNEQGKIEPTIRSLQAQTLENIQIVCVNDGSTDNTLAELEALAADDPRIKVVTKENGGSPAKAIDYGIKYIDGEYYFYSSKDDSFDADLFEKCYKRAEETGADCVVPFLVADYGDGDYSKGFFGPQDGDMAKIITGHQAAELCIDDYKIPGNGFFRSSIIREVGCLSEYYNSDEYSGKLYYLRCRAVAFCDGRFFYLQTDPTAYTRGWSAKLTETMEVHAQYIEMAKENVFSVETLQNLDRQTPSLFFVLVSRYAKSYKKLPTDKRLEGRAALKRVFDKYKPQIISGLGNTKSDRAKKAMLQLGFCVTLTIFKLKYKSE